MNCVICKVELVEEEKPTGEYVQDGCFLSAVIKPTGYHYCPSCGLVYKEKE